MNGIVIANSGLRVRNNFNLQAQVLKVLPLNTAVDWTETAEGSGMTWYKSSGGWISADWVKITSPSTSVVNTPSTLANPTPQTPVNNVPDEQELVAMTTSQLQKTLQGAAIGNYQFIKGLPYSFPNHVDRKMARNGGTDRYGREYVKTYLANTPVAVFTPCAPQFLPTSSLLNLKAVLGQKTNKEMAILALSKSDGSNSGMIEEFLNSVVDTNMQYFTTKSSYEMYMEYVNTLCRMSAISMGLGNYQYGGVALRNYDWGSGNQYGDPFLYSTGGTAATVKDVLGYDKSVAFAYDPSSSISNSISNSTTQSELSRALNGASAKVKEAEFLFGIGAGHEFKGASDDYLESTIPRMADMAKYDPDSLFGRLNSGLSTVLTGSNFRLPELWSDSSYMPSYNITMKFRAPYGTPLSVYFDVLVPFWHIFALGGARSVRPNEYHAPFLIRAYSPGYFNVEMGIIDTISFTKFGDGEDVTEMGIPLEIEVNVSFKDLYNMLGITNIKNVSAFFNNNGLLEMVGTMSGMNMSRADKIWAIQMYWDTVYNTVYDAPGNFMGRLQENARNSARDLLGY